MRIAVAGFIHETNTFLPDTTGLDAFGLRDGSGVPRGPTLTERVPAQSSFMGFVDAARADGHELAPLLYAWAMPSGVVGTPTFEALLGELVQDVQRQGPFDAVFIELHGAMVTERHLSADEEILRRIRAAIGPHCPLVVALDFHANVSAPMLHLADFMVAYRTYPHVDKRDTGQRVYAGLRQIATGTRGCAAQGVPIDFLMPMHRQGTSTEPLHSLYALLAELEADHHGAVTMSLAPGFPLADTPDSRPTVFGYATNAEELQRCIARLSAAVRQAEPGFDVFLVPPERAVALALQTSGPGGPVVLADVQDNPGAGGSADTMGLAKALLAARVDNAVIGLIHDPHSIAAAHLAGVGAEIPVAIGGTSCAGDSPLAGSATVVALFDGAFTLTGPMMRGTQVNVGKMALLRIEGLLFALSSKRAQCLDQDYLRVLGVRPERCRIVAVKSTNHFLADFGPIARAVIQVESPGRAIMNPAALPYRRLASGLRLYGNGPVFVPSGALHHRTDAAHQRRRIPALKRATRARKRRPH